jgi:membrane fusion protein, copper/silver efflux system
MKPLYLFLLLLMLAQCKGRHADTVSSDTYYTCSMDPQVVESRPGTCPICKMDLTPVKKSSGQKKDEIELSEQQIRLGNIHADTIRNGSIGDRMVLTATLNIDQMKAVSVSSRLMGRIERLYFRNQGDYVAKGKPLYDLYSDELNNAKQEYILAAERRSAFGSDAVIDVDQLLQGARNKLLLWGMTEGQIQELLKTRKASPTTTVYSPAAGYITDLLLREGDYVMEGGTIVKLADLSTLWAEAQVYASQLSSLNNSSAAIVRLPDMDGREVRGRIEFVNPEISPDTRINLVRVSIPNPGNQLRPGMPAYVVLVSPQRRSLSVPIDAVIRSGSGTHAWVRSSTHTFRSVMVRTGLETDDRIEILSGLKEGDVVVTSGAYLLHSEYVFRKGADL